MQDQFISRFPSVESLRRVAAKRLPRFAFEYLIGGANEEINLGKNIADLQRVELMPEYLVDVNAPKLAKTIFGHTYAAPFGIAPIGLQGLMWPGAPEILALTAHHNNIPFVLSTVTTTSIESIARITEGHFWFQLYYPAQTSLRLDVLKRAWDAGCRVLVLLADTPTFGIRYKDVKNGLAMPPKMTALNVFQMMFRPRWVIHTLRYGTPKFATLEKYMPKGLNLSQLGKFMNETFDGRLTESKIREIRDIWKGKLVIKGMVNEQDTEKAIHWGADGIVVSNHGGRQIDAGESSINSLQRLVKKYSGRINIMMDGGIRSGPDIARALAVGADFVFIGRPFMFGVGALGRRGGNHTAALFYMQLKQVMEQLGCQEPTALPKHLIKSS
ncbi:MAG: alpha-hydroxy acid oxidase [Bacteroidota bacterium]